MSKRRWLPLARALQSGPRLTSIALGATVAFHLLYLAPATRDAAEWFMREGSAVEDVTFASLLLASGLGLGLTLRARRNGETTLVWGCFGILSFGLFFVAMEEVSWGQWIFFFKTPESFEHLNRQGETNLHNLPGLFGRSEYLRLTFAVGGLAGLWLDRVPALRKVATPRALAGWFVVVTAYVLLDLVDDFVDAPWFFSTFSPMSEWVEMLIGLAALAYMLIKRDRFPRVPVVETRPVDAANHS